MKALVAAACIAVLAAVGYFFYGEYSEAVEGARVFDERSMRASCRAVLSDAEAGKTEGLEAKLTGCLLAGAVSQAEIDASIARAASRRTHP